MSRLLGSWALMFTTMALSAAGDYQHQMDEDAWVHESQKMWSNIQTMAGAGVDTHLVDFCNPKWGGFLMDSDGSRAHFARCRDESSKHAICLAPPRHEVFFGDWGASLTFGFVKFPLTAVAINGVDCELWNTMSDINELQGFITLAQILHEIKVHKYSVKPGSVRRSGVFPRVRVSFDVMSEAKMKQHFKNVTETHYGTAFDVGPYDLETAGDAGSHGPYIDVVIGVVVLMAAASVILLISASTRYCRTNQSVKDAKVLIRAQDLE